MSCDPSDQATDFAGDFSATRGCTQAAAPYGVRGLATKRE